MSSKLSEMFIPYLGKQSARPVAGQAGGQGSAFSQGGYSDQPPPRQSQQGRPPRGNELYSDNAAGGYRDYPPPQQQQPFRSPGAAADGLNFGASPAGSRARNSPMPGRPRDFGRSAGPQGQDWTGSEKPQAQYSDGKSLRVEQLPDKRLTVDDLVLVCPADFPRVRKESEFFLKLHTPKFGICFATARSTDNGLVAQGTIALSDPQRGWTELAPGDVISVEEYHPRTDGEMNSIGYMTLYVEFSSPSNATKDPYDMDELALAAKKNKVGHVYAPKQVFFMTTKGNRTVKCKVATVDLVDLSIDGKGASSADNTQPTTRGILTEETEMMFYKSANSTMEIRGGSATRQAPNAIIAPDFKFESLGIGGLDAEFGVIFRRAFASRIFPPGLVEKLGLPHVKGMLLYGPPGTGKTLIARQIGKMLNAREPKVINGPEVLNKYVGQSEENIRKMFGDAEKEYKEKGENSGLHIIIFDELDAVCKQRGSTSGGTGVGDSVVNQLLSKLDGVNQLNNILLIGMTNRKDMIDDALLRPGRLEVQIEIGLPDEHGRSQILGIHTEKLRVNKILGSDVNIPQLAALTKNFSGAEIAGLVRSASSFAMNRHVKVDSFAQLKDDVDQLEVGQADFLRALNEVKPAFGAPEDEISDMKPRDIIHYNSTIKSIISRAEMYWKNLPPPSPTQPGSVSNILLHGAPKSGTTALAAHLAAESQYPYVKLVTLGKLSNMRDEYAKADYIAKVFADAYKSPLSVIILDEIDLIFEYVPLGPRFSNHLLSVLKGKMKETPPKGHRLLIISTTCNFGIMDMVDLRRSFSATIQVPTVNSLAELRTILEEAAPFPTGQDVQDAIQKLEGWRVAELGLGIKFLLEEAFLSRGSEQQSAGQYFADSVGHAINDRMLSR